MNIFNDQIKIPSGSRCSVIHKVRPVWRHPDLKPYEQCCLFYGRFEVHSKLGLGTRGAGSMVDKYLS